MSMVAWIRDVLGMEEKNGTDEATTRKLKEAVKQHREEKDELSKSVMLLKSKLEGVKKKGSNGCEPVPSSLSDSA